jgi:hypothetical protein
MKKISSIAVLTPAVNLENLRNIGHRKNDTFIKAESSFKNEQFQENKSTLGVIASDPLCVAFFFEIKKPKKKTSTTNEIE